MNTVERLTELDAMAKTLDPITASGRGCIIVANARRICAMKWKSSPNWVLVSEVFGLGSTYSFHLCRALGIDPEARK